MILAFRLVDLIQIPFGYLLAWLNQLTTNYGVALILFAIILKIILFPATAKGKKSSMKMARITPKLQALQKKYAGDQQKLNEALVKLYREQVVPNTRKGLCAAIYTQVSDVEDEINGLLTYDRKLCKPEAGVMRAIAEKLQKAMD